MFLWCKKRGGVFPTFLSGGTGKVQFLDFVKNVLKLYKNNVFWFKWGFLRGRFKL